MSDGTERTVEASKASHPRSTVETIADHGARRSVQRATDGGDPERGSVIGRYLVISKLGAGAMGVVLAAYDPELDRKVALKLLHRRGSGVEHQGRLQREAQALARLNHPNVVAVHDVGVHEGRVFLAMEFVEGQTLREWMQRDRKRRWTEVVAVFEAAARGLAAAHAAGLIHRDFKPDNVLVGEDPGGEVDRVKVMDFGLARPGADESVEVRSTEPLEDERVQLEARMTRTGALRGTPAYMAPEQFRGTEVTARSDQFAFCVALFEALYGRRPFEGDTAAQIAYAVTEGKIVEPPRRPRVPGWLRQLVRRGLHSDPDDRFEDMESLLAILGRADARRRRTIALALGAVVTAGVAGFIGYQRFDEALQTQACRDASEIDEVWNEDVHRNLRDRLLSTGVGFAQETADRALPILDRYAEAIRTAQLEACLDARVRRTWSEDLLERATWCLEERRMDLAALVAELSRADPSTIAGGTRVASTLPTVEPCRKGPVLMQRPLPRGPEAVRDVRLALSKVFALTFAGKLDEAVDVSRGALELAQQADDAVSIAKARLVLGSSLDGAGDSRAAAIELEQAYFDAARAGAVDVIEKAANSLIFVVGYQLARHEEGQRWYRHTDVALEALADPEPGLARANAISSLGFIHLQMGELDEAETLLQRSLDIRRAALGENHPDVATTMDSLGHIHLEAGAYDRAKSLFERSLEIREAALGRHHPDLAASLGSLMNVAKAQGSYQDAEALGRRAVELATAAYGPAHPFVAHHLNGLGNIQFARGEYVEAGELYGMALAIEEAAYGPDHPEVAKSLVNVATVRRATDEYDAALELYRRALQITERALGSDHVTVAKVLNNMANVYSLTGVTDEAGPLMRRALEIYEARLGPEHPDVAAIAHNLGHVRLDQGDAAAAKVLFERALAIREKALGPDHPFTVYPLTGLARWAYAEKRWDEGLAAARRAVAIQASTELPTEVVARTQFILAQLLWDAPADEGGDRARAKEAARAALDGYRRVSDDENEADVAAWLATHR